MLSSREPSAQSYYPSQMQCNVRGRTCESAVSRLSPFHARSPPPYPTQRRSPVPSTKPQNNITKSHPVRNRLRAIRKHRQPTALLQRLRHRDLLPQRQRALLRRRLLLPLRDRSQWWTVHHTNSYETWTVFAFAHTAHLASHCDQRSSISYECRRMNCESQAKIHSEKRKMRKFRGELDSRESMIAFGATTERTLEGDITSTNSKCTAVSMGNSFSP